MYDYYQSGLIEEICANNDIVEVVGDYIKLERKGKDYFGLCPFHKEKTPSFSVAPLKQIFYCFGCGKGGNVIHFIMNIENLEFAEALKLLAERAKIPIPEDSRKEGTKEEKIKREIMALSAEAARYFHMCLKSEKGNKARAYLKRRGISEQTANKFMLGYAFEEWDDLSRYLGTRGFKEDMIIRSGLAISRKSGGCYDRFRDRLIFPIFDLRGNVIGFGGRVLDDSLPKYINSPETIIYNKGKNLYALNFAKNSAEKRLIVVEGYMDVIALHQSGIINSVASLGTSLTESQGRLLRKYAEEVIISYDADTAGQAATMRGLDLLNDMGCNVKVILIPDGKDPDDFIRKNGSDAFRGLIDKSVSLVEYKIKMLKNKTDMGNMEEKIRFLNNVADVLSKVKSSIEREMYIKKVAYDYGITAESLYSEVIKRMSSKTGKKNDYAGGKTLKNVTLRAVAYDKDEKLSLDEKYVLALLCINNDIYKEIKDKIPVDSFTDPANRRIASIVFERLENGDTVEPAGLLSIAEADSVAVFSKIISQESDCDDILKAILGKIKSIEIYKAQKRLKEISELLKDERSLKEGDVERLKKEMMSQIMLIKQQKSS